MIKEDFYIDLTEKNQILEYYKSLHLNTQNTCFYSSVNEAPFNLKKAVSIRLFPNYFEPVFNNNIDVSITKVPQKKINGYAVVLKQDQTFDTFFNAAFSKSFRANIKRFVTRFETCFTANYKLFHGDISEENYSFLMDALYGMLTNRFNQRNDENKILNNWAYYKETTYSLILSKKASLFVIYHNDIPVHICINHHFNNILFVSIPSYDIDYAKFALGNISIYKLLEWSVTNNYSLLDMAYGDLEYKRRWSTLIYPFEHHILYKNTLSHKLEAFIETNIIKFKNYLKSKNIDDLAKSIKKKLRKSNDDFKELTFTLEDTTGMDLNAYQKIDINNSEITFLKKPIFEFLYTQKIHIESIHVFEIEKSKSYIIYANNIMQKLILK